jgi:hypothetical protein
MEIIEIIGWIALGFAPTIVALEIFFGLQKRKRKREVKETEKRKAAKETSSGIQILKGRPESSRQDAYLLQTMPSKPDLKKKYALETLEIDHLDLEGFEALPELGGTYTQAGFMA